MFLRSRRSISIVLSVLMTLSLFGCLAFAAGAATYAVGDLIKYGSYPKTKVTDETLIAALEDEAKNWASYRYFANPSPTGSGGTAVLNPNNSPFNGRMEPGDWMEFADFFYGGEKYRAVRITEGRPHATQQKTNTGYQSGNGYPEGVYYFLYQPLTWRVLDPETGLVMCVDIVDCQPYQNVVYAVGVNDLRQGVTGESFTRYANNYAGSSVRAWLNYEFWETAFSPEQQANVKTSTVVNHADTAPYDAETTYDKVFLLSVEEATNTAYGFTNTLSADPNRSAIGTDYAYSQNLSLPEYWLRTASADHRSLSARAITSGGGNHGMTWVSDAYFGIRPLCRLSVLRDDSARSRELFSGLHTVTLSPGTLGGDAVQAQTAVRYTLPEAAATFSVPDDQICTGWLSDAPDRLFAAGEEVNVCKNTTFTAFWTQAVTVTFDPCGGSAVETQKIPAGTAAVRPADPVKSGAVFKGWRLGGVLYDFSAPLTENTVLHAVWVEGETLSLDFETALPEGWSKGGWVTGTGDSLSSIGPHSGAQNLKAARTYRSNSSTSAASTVAYDSANLMSRVMDLSAYPSAEINCWYINRRNLKDTTANHFDLFSVSYQVGDGEWTELFRTGEAHDTWTELTLPLPAAALADGVRFRFTAEDRDDYGVGLDDLEFRFFGVHDLSFGAAANVLTSTCANDPCGLDGGKLELTLNAPEKTVYGDGKDPAATLTDLDRFNFETGLALREDDIRYYRGDALLDAAPTAAGDYRAEFTASINGRSYTLTKTYAIARADAVVSELPPDLTAVYGEALEDVTLPEGWRWETPESSVGNAGENRFTALYCPDEANYAPVSAELTVTVRAKALTVTAEAQSKTYGESDPALTYTVDGLVGDDAVSGALARVTGEDVGVYAITLGTLTAGDNYTIGFTGADLTIGAKALTVTAEAQSKTYGESDPALTYTVDGLVGDDAVSGALARVTGEDVGVYAITLGTLTAGDNYTIGFTGADLTIGAKALTVTAEAQSKTYGESDPALTYTVDGLVGDDAVSGALARVTGEDVGVYAITLGTLTAGDNYTIGFTGADLTIGAKALTVTAEEKTKERLAADPALTYTVDGLVGDDAISVRLIRVPGEAVGEYEILADIDAGGNYAVTYVGAVLKIVPNAQDLAPTPDPDACPYCGETHDRRTVSGWWMELIHHILYIINRVLLWFRG